MGEPLTIHIVHKGKDLYLESELLRLGYTHKFQVMVQGVPVLFEPDEDGSYRAVLPDPFDEKTRRNIDPSLLQTIAETLHSQ